MPFRELSFSQCGNRRPQSVAMGQKRPFCSGCAMSAFPPTATEMLHKQASRVPPIPSCPTRLSKHDRPCGGGVLSFATV
jgi:hypothetical protein